MSQFALSLKRGGLSGARWIDPENYHITLSFIGDVDNQTANEVSAELDRLSQLEAFTIRLIHLGTFGGDKPRALYAGVENNEALQRLQAAQERVLQRAGLEPEGRKFVPHVSLARLRGSRSIEVAGSSPMPGGSSRWSSGRPVRAVFVARIRSAAGPIWSSRPIRCAA